MGMFFGKKKKAMADMCKWQEKCIPRSLFKLSTQHVGTLKRARRLKAESKELFKSLLCYSRDAYHQYPETLAHNFIKRGAQERLLRDELYCELVKQTTQNPSKESCLLTWKLMYMCLRCFKPSDAMSRVLFSHIAEYADPESTDSFATPADVATQCYKALWRMMTKPNAARRPPTEEEIQMMTQLKDSDADIFKQNNATLVMGDDEFRDVFRTSATAGCSMMKYNIAALPHHRKVKIIWDEESLDWETGRCHLSDIADIVTGSNSPVFHSSMLDYLDEEANDDHCMTVIIQLKKKERTLDLECDSEDIRDMWVRGLLEIVDKYQIGGHGMDAGVADD